MPEVKDTHIKNVCCCQFLLDYRHPSPSSFFFEGQTLEAKVTEVDQTKFRFLLSLRMMDCYHGDMDVGLRLLGNYLAENQFVLDRLKTCEGLWLFVQYSVVVS